MLLGRYAIGESRGFYTHHGLLNETKPVKVLECPPLREESQPKYYSDLEQAVHGLGGPVDHVVVLVKYSPIGFGGFRMDRQKNIPEFELLNLKKTLGNGVKDIIMIVVSNWSRQFARIADRRQKGVTEDLVAEKLKIEMEYSLSATTVPVYFMDTVFWRTEQKSGMVPNTLPTTVETLDILIMEFLKNVSVDHQSSSTREVNVDTSDSSDDDMENTIKLGDRWRNRKYQDLTENEYRPQLETSTLTFPVYKTVNLENSKRTGQENSVKQEMQRAVPVYVRSRSSSSSSDDSVPVPVHSSSRDDRRQVELSDYVEAKVKEMMDKEGVTLDFTDTKLRGKIVTKTTIIKEVRGGDGSSQFVEDELIDEKHFGSELDSLSSKSFSQYENKSRMEPIFSMGSPVLSSTFNRQEKNERQEETLQSRVVQIVKEEPPPRASSIRKSSSSSSSASSSDCETIEVIEEPDGRSVVSNLDLSELDAVAVVLGTEPNISHVHSFLKQRNVGRVLCSSVEESNGTVPYRSLAKKINPGENVIFIWAVETKTGEFLDDMVYMFADFIEAFSPRAIESMIVVLWHPGSMDDIRSSVEDLTRKFEQCIEYHSSIGFAVLHYKPIQRFYETLADKVMNVTPMRFNAEYVEPQIERSSSSETEVDSLPVKTVDAPMETVDSPVLLMVSPPGHGKSSIGNLLLGAGHFQVRGTALGGNQTLQVNTGWLYHEECRVTCIESPGLYEDGVDKKGVEEMERHLKDIGFITHLIVVWDSLEWRTEDLDFVLSSLRNIFGYGIVDHLLFVVTFWDSDQKSKKERSKRKLTPSSVTGLIRDKIDLIFSSKSDPNIFFVSAKNPNDRSRTDLANYLSATDWTTFVTQEMKSWMNELDKALTPGEKKIAEQDEGHDYEDIRRASAVRSSLGFGSKSKSLYNLDQGQSQENKSGYNSGKDYGSMFSVQGSKTLPRKTNELRNAKPRNRTKSPFGGFGTPKKGRGRGSTTNLSRKRSMSQGSIFAVGRGRGRGQRPLMMHQKSVDNVYAEDNDRGEDPNLNSSSRFEDADSIVPDANYQDPVRVREQARPKPREKDNSSGRGRRRVVSGSSFTLNLRGSSKDRRGSRTSLNRSKQDSKSDLNKSERDLSQPRRRESRINLIKQKNSGSRQNISGNSLDRRGISPSQAPSNRTGSRTSLNRSRDDLSENKGTIGGRRGRSRSRQNLNRNPRSQSLKSAGRGSRPPPGECNIL